MPSKHLTLEELQRRMGIQSDVTQYPKIRKNIYELDIYEATTVEVSKDFWIGVTRVPGGWIHMIKGKSCLRALQ